MRFVAWLAHDFAVWVLCRREPELVGRELLVTASGKIAGCTRGLRGCGVEMGWSLERARALAPEAVVREEPGPLADLAWEELLVELNRSTPRLESFHPGLAWSEAHELAVADLAERLGLAAGVAGDRSSALLAALTVPVGQVREIPPGRESEFRDQLPVNCLARAGISRDTVMRLLWFGWRTVGSLARLNRAQLEARFPEGSLLWELAHPADRRPLPLFVPPPEVRVAYQAEDELCEPAQYDPVLRELLQQAEQRLEGRLARWVSVYLELPEETRSARRFLAAPQAARFQTPARLALAECLARRRPAIERLEVALGGLQQPVPAQGRLWTDRRELKRRGLERALQRLRRRFPGSLKKIRLHEGEGYLPEEAWSLEAVR